MEHQSLWLVLNRILTISIVKPTVPNSSKRKKTSYPKTTYFKGLSVRQGFSVLGFTLGFDLGLEADVRVKHLNDKVMQLWNVEWSHTQIPHKRFPINTYFCSKSNAGLSLISGRQLPRTAYIFTRGRPVVRSFSCFSSRVFNGQISSHFVNRNYLKIRLKTENLHQNHLHYQAKKHLVS